MDTQLCRGVHWVGYVDWTVRDFHGYETRRGSTYNSYLIQDEKIVLVDTVKAPYADELLRHVQQHVKCSDIDYIVCNHAEPDHSGSLPAVMQACPQAELVCDEKCRNALSMHYDVSDWNFKIVKTGDTISLGSRTLAFVETPMAHWPESMATYMPEEQLLFSMDAFGQHYASANRFDDLEPLDVIMDEARTYYANILMLYGRPVSKVLKELGMLDLKIVAPSHGVIWRKNLDAILKAYDEWIVCKPRPKVLVIYDTMWKSTEKMARAIWEGAVGQQGIEARLLHVRSSTITEIATEVLDTACMAVGSPTLNQTLMPQVSATLTYLKGLKPANKAGFAFGSYGWGKGGATDVHQILQDMKVEVMQDPLRVQFVPEEADLEKCREAGKMLAQKALEMAGK